MSRRRRWRADCGHRLYRFLRDRMPARRRRRFPAVNRGRFIVAECVLILVIVGALSLSASVIVRSVRTARLNRRLAVMHNVSEDQMEAEVAAPPVESEIQTEQAAPGAAPVTVFHRTDLDILPEMQKLARENPDTIGWLGIGGVVYQPVVYWDNSYYLDHDFTGAGNASGTLFLDENHPLTSRTQNLLIHGHSMKDGSMFGILTHYRNLDFLRRHPLIAFSTLWEKEAYVVFAVLVVSSRTGDTGYFNYFDHATFTSGEDFDSYILALRNRSRFEIPVDVECGDALLTLSTCIDDDRLVVAARRLRVGETKDELSAAVEAAYRQR